VGTYVLTDTINKSFDEIFEESLRSTDVSVSSRESTSEDDVAPPSFSASLLDRARRVEGVEAAAGQIFSPARFVDRKGDPIGNRFAPNFVVSVMPDRFTPVTYVEGRKPRTRREAALDSQTAKRGKLEVGETLRVAGERAVTRYRIVGLTRLGDTSFGGAATAALVLPEAQRVTSKRGELDQLAIAAADGVREDELRRRVDRALPPAVLVETGKQAADRQSKDIAEDLGFLKIALLVFGGVAVFVGAFLIFNTFSITVAQRVREFGMLRTIGASRRQVLGSLFFEAAVTGGLGAALGVPGGIGAARGLNELFKAFEIDLPNTGTVLQTRTVLLGVGIGLAVTFAAALGPALRATRVSPIAALREGELDTGERRSRRLLATSLLLGLGGVVLMCVGLFGGIESSDSAAGMIGAGAAALLLGVSLFSPRLVRPVAAVVGRPLAALRGITGRLARENSVRKPGRTAVTAAALMIGLALVVFVTVFAAGISSSVSNAIDRNFQGDLVLQNIDGFSQISRRAGVEADRVRGVETRSSLSFAGGRMRAPKSETIRMSSVDPQTVNEVLTLDWREGSRTLLSRLGRRDAVMDEASARSAGIAVGDRVRIRTPIEKEPVYVVRGTVKDNADLVGDVLVTERSLRRLFGTRSPSITFLKLRPGVDAGAVQRRVARRVEKRYPTVQVLNQTELKDKQEEQINQLVAMLYLLLALAVIVSLFGIANTLTLSIHERTRELGLLRTVGMSRSQVRRVVRYEAVITALIGALLGLVMGVVFAALMSRPLSEEGFELSYPIGTLVLLLVLAALAGVVAAIWPARRASRVDVLEALAYE
jgi:putative ABC transport system permease protein